MLKSLISKGLIMPHRCEKCYIVETYLPEFFAFFFPDAYTAIDWERGFDFLDQELRQVVRDAELGQRFVDKLVKVYLKDGEETWILIHLEIQSQYESQFAERIYVYNYRIFDKYRRRVASFIVLGDENTNWRPSEFGYEIFGCQVNFSFPVVKLLDLGQDWEALVNNRNPFATVVMAHLKAHQTRNNRQERLEWKLSLTRRLYQQGYQRQDVINLFRFIDWLMSLPKNLEQEFWREIRQLEEETRMPYITSVERLGIEQGMQREGANLVLRLLNRRFGQVTTSVEKQIRQLSVEQLEDLGEALLDFENEADLLHWLSQNHD
ncbi:DUF4351 domain-containing protein [Microcystis aeruginosa FBCC-A68]|uniref:DUF4351 domain-containing protein n=3 Tax=Microcystis TaxID=1125 RepID=UPI0020166E1B|nr:DUF4351 domain-containing protein [Microcystis aeruginosa]